MKKLASLIAKYEGKKNQARIGEIREILKIMGILDILFMNTHDFESEVYADAQLHQAKMTAKIRDLISKGLTPEQVINKLMRKAK